jgi:hypothetical protein
MLVPAAACAAVCVIAMRIGLLSLLFLVPLGFSAVAFGPWVAWLAFALAAVGNAVVASALAAAHGLGAAGAALDVLYFTALASGFVWVMAGNPPWLEARGIQMRSFSGLQRFVAASAAAALSFLGMAFWFGRDGFDALLPLLESLASADAAAVAAGGDAVTQSLLERALDPENLLALVVAVTLRGGALFSAALLLFFSRQAAFLAARLLRRGRPGIGDMAGFFAPRRAIWAFSLSLPAVMLGRALSIPAAEIAAWNVLVMCALMFLAQGGGIALFNLARRPMPLPLRVLLGVGMVVIAFTPGLNLFALGALLVLGIVENWVPMRRAASEGEPSP